jgi:phage tail sheath gpL-like
MADTPFNILRLPGVYEPGVYASVVYDSDPGLAAPNNRCLLTGYFTAGYQAVSDVPVRVLSQADADVLFGPKSMLSHAYAAAKKQIPVGAEVWALPLTAPSRALRKCSTSRSLPSHRWVSSVLVRLPCLLTP